MSKAINIFCAALCVVGAVLYAASHNWGAVIYALLAAMLAAELAWRGR